MIEEKESVSLDQAEHSMIFSEIKNISSILSEVRTQLKGIDERLRVSEISSERINGRLELGSQKFSIIDERLRILNEEHNKQALELVRLHASLAVSVSRDTLDARTSELNKTIEDKVRACITKESFRWLLAGATLAGGATGAIAGKLIGMF